MEENKKRKGFTLVELIVVIVILGILMLIGSMKYADVKDEANLAVLKSNHRTLVSALQLKMAEKHGALLEDAEFAIGSAANSLAPSIESNKPQSATYTYNKATGKLVSTYKKTDGTVFTITTDLADGTTTES